MDKIINGMIDALNEYNAGYISVTIGEYTIIITNDKEGADYLSNAWEKYAEGEN